MEFVSSDEVYGDVSPIKISDQRMYDQKPFPLVLSPTSTSSNLAEWMIRNRDNLRKLLLDHKAILFRNFTITDPQGFHEVIEASGLEGMEYVGGAAVRTQITSRVFTANESPSSEKIPFHHEMSQVPEPPTHLFFFCERAPADGGETPILVSAEVCDRLQAVRPEFMSALELQGVRYARVMGEDDDPTSAIGRGWKSTYLTTDRVEAEKKMASQGVSWEWDFCGEGTLRTVTAALPAIRVDSGEGRTGAKTFFNSVVAAYTGWNDSRNTGEKAVLLGEDMCPCDADAIADAVRIMDEICIAFKWQPGDILFLDNRTVMHSRRPYVGDRRILASLVRDYST